MTATSGRAAGLAPALFVRPKQPGPARPPAWRVLTAAVVAVLVAHGCHGADEDHEPAVLPPAERDRGRPVE